MGVHVHSGEQTHIAILTVVIDDSISVGWRCTNGVLNQVR